MVGYDDLLAEFKEWLDTDKNVQYLWKLNTEGKADYVYADAYANGISKKWSELLTDAYGSEMDEGVADEIAGEVAKAYKKAYSETAYYSKTVQNGINKKAKIGMKAIEPKLNDTRLKNLVDTLKSSETTTEMAKHLLENSAINSISKTAVNDTIQANARIQSKAGLYGYVERDAGSGCCAWCEEMAGRYEYGDVPDDFWRVHSGCTCTFTYKPSKDEVVHIRYETNGGRLSKVTD